MRGVMDSYRGGSNVVLYLAVCLSLLLSGCSEITEALDDLTNPPANLRPFGSPDVVILGFAGRCGPPGCGAPSSNKAYLSDTENNTLQVMAETFESSGHSVRTYSYAATVSQYENDHFHPGYYEAQGDLDRIYTDWIAGFDNPTRLILVGHSHGAVWSSLLAMENPHVAFDVGVYLDGVCNQWEQDNLYFGFWTDRNLVAEFYAGVGAPYPATLDILGGACNAYPVPGFGYKHLKDVVPWNVTVGVELQSDPATVLLPDSIGGGAVLETQGKCAGGGWVGVKDQHLNLRPDGSLADLYIYYAAAQDHCELVEHGGPAMQSLLSFFAERGLAGLGGSSGNVSTLDVRRVAR